MTKADGPEIQRSSTFSCSFQESTATSAHESSRAPRSVSLTPPISSNVQEIAVRLPPEPKRAHTTTMWSRLRSSMYRYRPPPLLPTAIRTIQLVAAYHLFSTDVLELRFCAGFSMFPTFSYEGDLVAVSPIPYWSMFADKGKKRGPRRGDVVVFTKPTDPEVTVLKRVVGIAGDIIEIEPRRGSENTWDAGSDEEVWAGHGGDVGGGSPGHVVKRRTDSEGRPLRVRRKGEGQWVKVPKGHVWVQGDNFSNSTDSRSYGPVPIGCIKGKVLARVYPNFRWMSNPLKPFEDDPPRLR